MIQVSIPMDADVLNATNVMKQIHVNFIVIMIVIMWVKLYLIKGQCYFIQMNLKFFFIILFCLVFFMLVLPYFRPSKYLKIFTSMISSEREITPKMCVNFVKIYIATKRRCI